MKQYEKAKKEYFSKIDYIKKHVSDKEEQAKQLELEKKKYQNVLKMNLSSAIQVINKAFNCQYKTTKIKEELNINFEKKNMPVSKTKEELVADMNYFQSQLNTVNLINKKEVELAIDIISNYYGLDLNMKTNMQANIQMVQEEKQETEKEQVETSKKEEKIIVIDPKKLKRQERRLTAFYVLAPLVMPFITMLLRYTVGKSLIFKHDSEMTTVVKNGTYHTLITIYIIIHILYAIIHFANMDKMKKNRDYIHCSFIFVITFLICYIMILQNDLITLLLPIIVIFPSLILMILFAKIGKEEEKEMREKEEKLSQNS